MSTGPLPGTVVTCSVVGAYFATGAVHKIESRQREWGVDWYGGYGGMGVGGQGQTLCARRRVGARARVLKNKYEKVGVE